MALISYHTIIMTFADRQKTSLIRAGFTLIELLVVIAIIGLLASIVLASLNSARSKSRNTRRLADIKQLQVALEFYFDGFGQANYPLATTGAANCSVTIQYGLEGLSAQSYIPAVPRDPSNSTCYKYSTAQTGGRTTYHLGASMEPGVAQTVLNSDRDCNDQTGAPAPVCPTGANTTGFSGADTAACQTGDTGTICYDVIP